MSRVFPLVPGKFDSVAGFSVTYDENDQELGTLSNGIRAKAGHIRSTAEYARITELSLAKHSIIIE